MAGVGADADADVDAALASPSDMDETEQDVVDPMFKADPDADIDADAEAEAVADADSDEPPLPETGPGTTGAKAKAKAKSDSGSGSGSDEIAVRLNKLISTTAGLGSLLATINFSANLAIYLSVRLPVWWSALVSRYVTRTRRRQGQGQGQQVPVAIAAAVAAIAATAPPVLTSLASLASLISDWRKSQRLTGLIPLYTRLRLLMSTTNPAIQALDPVLRGLFFVQCHAYIVFQAVENLCHLQSKGLLPASASSLVERRGGFARWAVWSYRAWCLGVVTNFLRLAREADLVRRREGRRRRRRSNRQSTHRHGEGGGEPDGDGHEEGEGDGEEGEAATEEFYRKFWNEILISACWFPIALHISLPPKGIRGMNQGISSTLSLVATVMGLRSHWRATAA
ncbi:hypothetical protein Z517_06625 [Fonsecaea pedrosoi CBS 271.37]|uniref:Uncharacterized protein n=1 Tax=Fonsecaea pedrosoi CBS 271.37 TaxID=1442368 RepID=A0A0D2GNC4_9EURO|nr:uncharacterized protein Z517_06625 [Fonsecaea pedrosoi CBS 271.37]KIW80010.1 hypothetical protein Z517_06625 [Fonsecaea pedrosoi CBS 271.37]